MFGETAITQIKKVLRNSVSSNYIAGGNLLIVKDGKEIFYHDDGYADMEEDRPIKRDVIFRLYSMTKPVTAVAAMILLERGEIDLHEPVGKFLEGFKNQVVDNGEGLVPAGREVTIKDLLSMTSGLVYPRSDMAGLETGALFEEIEKRLLGDSPMTTLEAMNKLGKCPLAFHPGSAWQYGTSADVLGAVIEAVSGMSFGDFLFKELFEPLRMKDTGFWVPVEKRSRLVKTYSDGGKGGLMVYTGNHLGVNNKMDRKPAFESGGAGLASTIDDYSRFSRMLINEGCLDGVRILNPRTVRYLTSGTLNAIQQKSYEFEPNNYGYSYGNMMRVMTDCTKAGDMGCSGEYGWNGWLGSYFCNCPKEKLTFLFMMQKTDAGFSTIAHKLRNIILSVCC